MDSSERLAIYKSFREETDPAKREAKGCRFARSELAFLLEQLYAGPIKLDLIANAFRDLASELQSRPGNVIIKADDPEVPLRSSSFRQAP